MAVAHKSVILPVLFSGALHKQFLETAEGFIFIINYVIVPRLQLFKNGSHSHA